MCKHPVLVKKSCGDVDGDDVGGRVKTSAVEVTTKDRLVATPAEVRDCRSGGRRPATGPPLFRGGRVLPYSRASLSFVRELIYLVYLRSPYVIGQTITFCPVISIFFLLLMVALCDRADHYIFAL